MARITRTRKPPNVKLIASFNVKSLVMESLQSDQWVKQIQVGVMAFERTRRAALDYYPCQYGASKLVFRGPRREISENYIAFLGGTETYGKFVKSPFPALIEQEIGTDCINFAVPNAGADVYLQDREIIKLISAAKIKVIQVMGAQNLSNRLYSVHPRRNDRFLAPSEVMKTIFPEADFTEFNFTRHLLEAMAQRWPSRYRFLQRELRNAWVARMNRLLSRIGGNCILLWFSDRLPEDSDPGPSGREPLLVTREMIEKLRPRLSEVVEVKVSGNALALGSQGMVFSEMDAPAAEKLFGPSAHAEVSKRLQGPLSALLSRRELA